MAAAMKRIGATEPAFRYTEFPGVGHNAWSPAWDTPGLWEWLVAQRRGGGGGGGGGGARR